MKVIFVTRGWPSQNDFMRGNYEAVQAKALAKRGIDISVFCIDRNFKQVNNNKIEVICDDGITVYKCYPSQSSSIIRRITGGLSNIRFNERSIYQAYMLYVKEHGMPDIIHGHIIPIVYNCRFLLKKHNIPLVITEHWSRINYPLWKEPRLLWWKRMYNRASQVIAVSNPLANSLKKKFNVDSIVIGNMVDNCYFDNQLLIQNKDGFTFVSVGNLLPRKGFDLLIRAFKKCAFNEKVCLKIIGDGQERENLNRLVENLELQGRVQLLGRKKPEEVSMIMSLCNCYVLSSHVETFGIVCIEAMAKGLPVIATRCSGPEDIINDINGILVPVGDVDALATGMKAIYSNIDNYDREKIRHYCYEHYSEESISDKIIKVYEKVLSNREF